MATVRPIRAGLSSPMSDDEAQIRQRIEDFHQAFAARDLDRILSFYAPEVMAYDLMPPLQVKGFDAWRDVWARTLPMMEGTIQSEFKDLHITISGDLAVCHALSHFRLTGGKEEEDIWMRWTGALKKINGEWLNFHEHTSVPVEMESGKALTRLKP